MIDLKKPKELKTVNFDDMMEQPEVNKKTKKKDKKENQSINLEF